GRSGMPWPPESERHSESRKTFTPPKLPRQVSSIMARGRLLRTGRLRARRSDMMRRDVDCTAADASAGFWRPPVLVLPADPQSRPERVALPPRHVVGMRGRQCAVRRRVLHPAYV